METEVDNYLQDIPDQIVEAFFEANKRRMPLTLRLPRQEASAQVRVYMAQQVSHAARQLYRLAGEEVLRDDLPRTVKSGDLGARRPSGAGDERAS